MKWLAFGAAAVALAIALVWWLSRDDAAAPKATSTTEASTATGPRAPVASPSGGDDPGSARTPGSAAPTYNASNVDIRDHRGSGSPSPAGSGSAGPPPVLPPNIHPPGSRELPLALTSTLSTRMRSVVYGCAKDIPPDVRRGAKLESQVTLAVREHNLVVVGSTVVPGSALAAAAPAFAACVEQQASALAIAAPDEDSLEDYTYNLSYTLP